MSSFHARRVPLLGRNFYNGIVAPLLGPLKRMDRGMTARANSTFVVARPEGAWQPPPETGKGKAAD